MLHEQIFSRSQLKFCLYCFAKVLFSFVLFCFVKLLFVLNIYFNLADFWCLVVKKRLNLPGLSNLNLSNFILLAFFYSKYFVSRSSAQLSFKPIKIHIISFFYSKYFVSRSSAKLSSSFINDWHGQYFSLLHPKFYKYTILIWIVLKKLCYIYTTLSLSWHDIIPHLTFLHSNRNNF